MKISAYNQALDKLAVINKNIAAVRDELARATTAEDRADSENELRVFTARRAKLMAEIDAIAA